MYQKAGIVFTIAKTIIKMRQQKKEGNDFVESEVISWIKIISFNILHNNEENQVEPIRDQIFNRDKSSEHSKHFVNM